MVAAAIRTTFAQPSAAAVAAHFTAPSPLSRPSSWWFPVVPAMLVNARDDLLGFTPILIEHWRNAWPAGPGRRFLSG